MSTALVTGASTGIGFEIAKCFAADKINLVLVARSEDKLHQIAQSFSQEFGIQVTVIAKDLSNYFTAKEVYDECQAKQLQIDYLVNNAGFGDFGFFVDSNWAKQEQMINLNITTLTYLTRLFLPHMVQNKKGKILNVASTASFQPGPTMSVYYATKAYVLHFSEAIANEVKKSGVTVTTLCPGATDSDFQNKAEMHESRLVKNRKLPTAKEVAIFGYKAMHKGKLTVIHGVLNYFLANSIRFTPRAWVLPIVRYIQGTA